MAVVAGDEGAGPDPPDVQLAPKDVTAIAATTVCTHLRQPTAGVFSTPGGFPNLCDRDSMSDPTDVHTAASGVRLQGKVAVVTGGAHGIGRACCERFAAEGASVVIADVAGATQTLAAIEAGGGRAITVQADAASASDNEEVMDRAVETFGGIDVLVTAAGISHADYRSGDVEGGRQRILDRLAADIQPSQQFVDLSLADWQRVLDINLTGTFLAVQAAARRMVTAGRGGSIITIASIAAKDPQAGPLAYAVSKSGVWMLTKHAARSLGPAGIRVNSIGPGYIETNMTAAFSAVPGVREQVLSSVPLGRMGRPEEVAATALFLASDDASYFTGELIHPDGGWFTG
ncbi:MAG: SDR family oxidoreductase [Acidimicrobiales bacterium]